MGEDLAADGRRLHFERGDAYRLRGLDPLGEAVDPPVVHEEADGSAVHSEHRRASAVAVQHLVKRVEHEAVAAERHENLGLVDLVQDEAALQERFGRLCDVGVRGQQADPARRQVDGRLLRGESAFNRCSSAVQRPA